MFPRWNQCFFFLNRFFGEFTCGLKWACHVLYVVVHGATSAADDTSMITMALLKKGGNAEWFARFYQGPKNFEWFKAQNQVAGRKWVRVTLSQLEQCQD